VAFTPILKQNYSEADRVVMLLDRFWYSHARKLVFKTIH